MTLWARAACSPRCSTSIPTLRCRDPICCFARQWRQAASAIADGIEEDRFLILTHPEVLGFFQNKATDYGRWLGGMRRVRDRLRAGGFLKVKS